MRVIDDLTRSQRQVMGTRVFETIAYVTGSLACNGRCASTGMDESRLVKGIGFEPARMALFGTARRRPELEAMPRQPCKEDRVVVAGLDRTLSPTRTQDGREAAQVPGVEIGRPSKLRDDQE